MPFAGGSTGGYIQGLRQRGPWRGSKGGVMTELESGDASRGVDITRIRAIPLNLPVELQTGAASKSTTLSCVVVRVETSSGRVGCGPTRARRGRARPLIGDGGHVAEVGDEVQMIQRHHGDR